MPEKRDSYQASLGNSQYQGALYSRSRMKAADNLFAGFRAGECSGLLSFCCIFDGGSLASRVAIMIVLTFVSST